MKRGSIATAAIIVTGVAWGAPTVARADSGGHVIDHTLSGQNVPNIPLKLHVTDSFERPGQKPEDTIVSHLIIGEGASNNGKFRAAVDAVVTCEKIAKKAAKAVDVDATISYSFAHPHTGEAQTVIQRFVNGLSVGHRYAGRTNDESATHRQEIGQSKFNLRAGKPPSRRFTTSAEGVYSRLRRVCGALFL